MSGHLYSYTQRYSMHIYLRKSTLFDKSCYRFALKVLLA